MRAIVWMGTCAWALLACGSTQPKGSAAIVAMAVPALQRPAIEDLGGGCTVQTAEIGEGESGARAIGAQYVTVPHRVIVPLGDDRSLLVWMEIAGEAFDLSTRVVGEGGREQGPPLTLSINVVGRPVAAADPAGEVRIWFAQETGDRIRRFAATARCRR